MKATGIIRKIDPLGRIALPLKIRTTFDINKDDPFEVFIDGQNIVLQKYTPGCIFCGEAHEVSTVFEKNVCQQCLDAIKKST